MKFTIITGYQGAADIDVALERGELQCRLITIAAFFGREPHITWFKKGFTRPFVQTGRKRDPLLPETPTLYDLMDRYKTRDADRRLATLVMAPNEFGRPWTAPPGMAAERLKILREAWSKTLKDPDLLAEAKKRRLAGGTCRRRGACGAGERSDRAAAGGCSTTEKTLGRIELENWNSGVLE